MVPSIQVIIVLYNSAQWVAGCLEAVAKLDYPRFETYVVDNSSSDGGADLVEDRFPWAHLVRSRFNRGFAGGVNLGARQNQDSDLIFLLNPDAEIRSDCLSHIADAFASHDNLGVVGCKIFGPDAKTVEHLGGGLRKNALPYHIDQSGADERRREGLIHCDYVQGAALGVRRSLWDRLGGFDEGFFPAYFEEADFCRRTRDEGWEVAVTPDATLVHHQDAERQVHDWLYLEMLFRGRARYLVKHYTPREWLTQFLPAEAKWLFSHHSKRYRRIALRTLWHTSTATQMKPIDLNAYSRRE